MRRSAGPTVGLDQRHRPAGAPGDVDAAVVGSRAAVASRPRRTVPKRRRRRRRRRARRRTCPRCAGPSVAPVIASAAVRVDRERGRARRRRGPGVEGRRAVAAAEGRVGRAVGRAGPTSATSTVAGPASVGASTRSRWSGSTASATPRVVVARRESAARASRRPRTSGPASRRRGARPARGRRRRRASRCGRRRRAAERRSIAAPRGVVGRAPARKSNSRDPAKRERRVGGQARRQVLRAPRRRPGRAASGEQREREQRGRRRSSDPFDG